MCQPERVRGQFHVTYSFSRLAEYARTLAKGSHVMVQGSVRTREYEKDGITKRVFELRADSIGKLDRAERRQEGDAEPEGYDS